MLAENPKRAPGEPSESMRAETMAATGWRGEIPAVVATLALTLIAVALSLQLWRADPAVPFQFDGDSAFNEMTVQNIIDTGWYENAPRIGAPFGTALYDFPQGGDNLQFLMIRGLTWFSSDAGVVTNAYFLLTFVLVALAALMVLRWLGVSRAVAAVLAVLYSCLPYHFFRGEHHLFLSGYYAIPLGVALAFTATQGEPLFGRRIGVRGPAAFAHRRTFATLGLIAVIGSSGAYYAAFVLVLLIAAGGLRAVRERALGAALPAALVAAGIVGFLGLNLLPNAVYRTTHGANPRVAQRAPAESERFGLKLSSMLLPDPTHRIASLGALSANYQATSDVPSEGGQSLGILGAVGLLWLLAVAISSVAGGKMIPGRTGRHQTLAFLATVSLLTGTIGGFSVLIAYFVTPQFRSWNRFSVVLGFLALASVGLLLDRWWADRLVARLRAGTDPGRRRRVAAGGLAALFAIGLFDQTTTAAVPTYRANAAQHASDRAFVAAIEGLLPRDAMVYQLPFVAFPESASIAGTEGYEQFRGYFLSKHLRWSFGGLRGRDHDWQDALLGQPVDLFVSRVASVGFAGLWIDRDGYLDRAAKLERTLSDRLGAAPLVSPDGGLSFFSLVQFGAKLRRSQPPAALDALAAQTRDPVQVRRGEGTERHREDGQTTWIDGQEEALLEINNPDPQNRTVVFDARIETAGTGTLSISWPGGSVETVPLSGGETVLHREVVVNPGASSIRFVAQLPAFPAREAKAGIRFRLLQPALYDKPPTGF